MGFLPQDIHPPGPAGLDRTRRKLKVLQSIASVIQAMPPIDEIPVIEVCLESTPTRRVDNSF
jgi:hypothetical protein